MPIDPSWSAFYQNAPFTQAPGFEQIISSAGGTPGTNPTAANALRDYASQFSQMFEQETGQVPTTADFQNFFSNVLIPNLPGSLGSGGSANIPQNVLYQGEQGLLNNLYGQNIASQNVKNATSLSQQTLSGLNSLAPQLQTYLKNVLTQLQPDLITSLNAQGLTDTGGLNEAFAGAASDATSRILGPAFAGATGLVPGAANLTIGSQIPNQVNQGNTGLANLFQLQGSSADAYNRAYQGGYWGSAFNTNPSPLQMIGGNILGGVSAGFGNALGHAFTPQPTA